MGDFKIDISFKTPISPLSEEYLFIQYCLKTELSVAKQCQKVKMTWEKSGSKEHSWMDPNRFFLFAFRSSPGGVL